MQELDDELEDDTDWLLEELEDDSDWLDDELEDEDDVDRLDELDVHWLDDEELRSSISKSCSRSRIGTGDGNAKSPLTKLRTAGAVVPPAVSVSMSVACQHSPLGKATVCVVVAGLIVAFTVAAGSASSPARLRLRMTSERLANPVVSPRRNV